jgi:hypothetical protein
VREADTEEHRRDQEVKRSARRCEQKRQPGEADGETHCPHGLRQQGFQGAGQLLFPYTHRKTCARRVHDNGDCNTDDGEREVGRSASQPGGRDVSEGARDEEVHEQVEDSVEEIENQVRSI